MGNFNIKCPKCGTEYDADEKDIGLDAVCEKCSANIKIEKPHPQQEIRLFQTPEADKRMTIILKPLDSTPKEKVKNNEYVDLPNAELIITCSTYSQTICLDVYVSNVYRVRIPSMKESAGKIYHKAREIVKDIAGISKFRSKRKFNINDVYFCSKDGSIEVRLELIFDIYADFEDKVKIRDMLALKYGVKLEVLSQ